MPVLHIPTGSGGTGSGACGWSVDACECSALDRLDENVQALVEDWAVQMLWSWTHERFGPCDVTVRPCRRSCMGGSDVYVSFGSLIGLGCNRCGDDCSCSHVSEILLPGPVASITEIWVDGELLPLSDVRVDNWNLLVRTDGGEWPTCQDLGANFDEPGGWSVRYARGEPVPAGGSVVAGILACELAKSVCDDDECRLPKRIQTISREGMTVGFVDQFAGISAGGSGIWEIDAWIASANAPRSTGVVSSPDVPKQRFTTWTWEGP